VLVYHAVGEERAYPYSVGVVRFREQIRLVKSLFSIIPLREVPAALREGTGRRAAVTFDDGFTNIREVVHPILAEEGVPYTVFVPSGFMGREAGPWAPSPLPIMAPGELRALAATGLVDFGSHTLTHGNLGAMKLLEVRNELRASKLHLEEALEGKPVDLFSFPFGQIENAPRSADLLLREAGYRVAVTTRQAATNAPDRLFRLNRIALREEESESVWREKLLGQRDWYTVKERGGHVLRTLSGLIHGSRSSLP
jgi:peptidoglycan/xylan/chitin deacetylase (PgdA/CDA1 family)